MKNPVLLLAMLACVGCFGGDATDGRDPRNMAKDTPEVRALLERFELQEHRVEVFGCGVRYNGREINLGDAPEDVVEAMGTMYDTSFGSAYQWDDAQVIVRFEKDRNVVEGMLVHFSDPYDYNSSPDNKNIVKVTGVPLDKSVLFGKFVGMSYYDFADFAIKSDYFSLYSKSCVGSIEGKLIIFSQPVYHYKHAGHIQIKHELDTTKTNVINTIAIEHG